MSRVDTEGSVDVVLKFSDYGSFLERQKEEGTVDIPKSVIFNDQGDGKYLLQVGNTSYIAEFEETV